MMESTLSYAMRVIRCEYESSEEHVKRIFDTVFPPVMTLICPTPIWNQCLRVQGKDDCLNLHEQDIQNGIIQVKTIIFSLNSQTLIPNRRRAD